MTNEQRNFIARVSRMAVMDMKKSKILASLKISQAILESGWGRSMLTVRANALYGIKAGAGWQGRVFSAQTQEFYDGINATTITALFRAYDSWEESVADHSALLTGLARYRAVVGETCFIKACRAVHAAGYATDPQYADKLIRLIKMYSLYGYDYIAEPGGGESDKSENLADAVLTAMKIRRGGVLHTARSIMLEGFNYVFFRDIADILGVDFIYHDETKEIEIIES